MQVRVIANCHGIKMTDMVSRLPLKIFTNVVDPHWLQYGSREPNQCGSGFFQPSKSQKVEFLHKKNMHKVGSRTAKRMRIYAYPDPQQ